MKMELIHGPYILIADDDIDDHFLIRQAFSSLKSTIEIKTVQDGVELLDYLHKREKFANYDKPYPKVILLDLNMPKKDGRECLKEIKSHPELRKIPVVIYSTSNNPSDIALAYELGANSYITKPYSFTELIETMDTFKKYWFDLVKNSQISY